jgi:hypothetical protein
MKLSWCVNDVCFCIDRSPSIRGMSWFIWNRQERSCYDVYTMVHHRIISEREQSMLNNISAAVGPTQHRNMHVINCCSTRHLNWFQLAYHSVSENLQACIEIGGVQRWSKNFSKCFLSWIYLQIRIYFLLIVRYFLSSVAFSPQEIYIGRAIAACWRS